MNSRKYIFDLDNTLVFTDELNNRAYNHALYNFNGSKIMGIKRITRKVVVEQFKELNKQELTLVINNKQKYFIDNVKLTTKNANLIELLKTKNADDCILWTSADHNRVNAILKHYDLINNFKNIIYSIKEDINKDINDICEILNCHPPQLVFFEDNFEIIKALRNAGMYTIDINNHGVEYNY